MIKRFSEWINESQEGDGTSLYDIRRLWELGLIDQAEYLSMLASFAKLHSVDPATLVQPGEISQDPQETIDKVLEVWSTSEYEDLADQYSALGFKVKTLSQIQDERDIPSGSVIFTYEDDPSDLCYYKKDAEIFVVTMGSFYGESLDEDDGRLEELLGVEFGNDSYEDLIISVTPWFNS